MSFGKKLKCHTWNVFADTNSSHVEFWYLWYFNGGLAPLCVFSSCSSSNLFHPSELWRLINAIFIIIPFFPQQFVNIKRNKSQEQTCRSNLIVFWSSQSQLLALKVILKNIYLQVASSMLGKICQNPFSFISVFILHSFSLFTVIVSFPLSDLRLYNLQSDHSLF